MRKIADTVDGRLLLSSYLFAIATTESDAQSLIICGSSEDLVQRAVLLTGSKFIGRIESAYNEGRLWGATITELGTASYDERALWDVLRKSARSPIDTNIAPPPGSRGIDEILSDARAKLQRISARQAYRELRDPQVAAPTFLVDIRPAAHREAEGVIHGSLLIERNVLEWRFDPRSASRLDIADRYDLRAIVFCSDGQASRWAVFLADIPKYVINLCLHFTLSLAALSLQELGLLNATDIIGGYKAWREEELPGAVPPPTTMPSSPLP